MFVLHGGQGRQGELERWKLFLGFNRGVILFLQAGEVTNYSGVFQEVY